MAASHGFVGGMVTSAMPKEQLQWMIDRKLKFPRDKAAALIYNRRHHDWRDLMSGINVPTMCIGGCVSLVPLKSVAWSASQTPSARPEIFGEAEGRPHFMFVENPTKFNRLLADFMG